MARKRKLPTTSADIPPAKKPTTSQSKIESFGQDNNERVNVESNVPDSTTLPPSNSFSLSEGNEISKELNDQLKVEPKNSTEFINKCIITRKFTNQETKQEMVEFQCTNCQYNDLISLEKHKKNKSSMTKYRVHLQRSHKLQYETSSCKIDFIQPIKKYEFTQNEFEKLLKNFL